MVRLLPLLAAPVVLSILAVGFALAAVIVPLGFAALVVFVAGREAARSI